MTFTTLIGKGVAALAVTAVLAGGGLAGNAAAIYEPIIAADTGIAYELEEGYQSDEVSVVIDDEPIIDTETGIAHELQEGYQSDEVSVVVELD